MAMIFRAVVFTFIPTAIELALVSWLLARSFSPSVAALVVATFVAYVGWTTLMTKVPLLRPCTGGRHIQTVFAAFTISASELSLSRGRQDIICHMSPTKSCP